MAEDRRDLSKPEEVNFPPHVYDVGYVENPGWYKDTIINPFNLGNRLSPSDRGTELEYTIMLPANQPFNLARSSSEFDMTHLSTATAGMANFKHRRSEYSRVRLVNSNSQIIMDLSNAQEYSQTVRRARQSLKKYQVNTGRDGSSMNRVLKNSIAALYPTTAPGNQGVLDEVEPQYLVSTPQGTNIVTNARYKMGEEFPDTFLALDIDVCFPEQMQLIFTLAAENSMVWKAANQGDPVTNAQSIESGVYVAANVLFRLKVQQEPNIRNKVLSIFKSGAKMPIPFLFSARRAIGANTGAISMDYQFTSSNGQDLQGVYWSLFDGNRTSLYNAGLNTNLGGAVILNYQTYLNTIPLQQVRMDCTGTTNYDDYEYNKTWMGDSPVAQDRRIYQKTPVHFDNFAERQPTGKQMAIQQELIVGGQKLSSQDQPAPSIYNINATLIANNNASALITWALLQKTLTWDGIAIKVE